MEKNLSSDRTPTPNARFDALWSTLRPDTEDASVEESSLTINSSEIPDQNDGQPIVIKTEVEGYTPGSLRPRVRSIECMVGEHAIRLNDVMTTFSRDEPKILEALDTLEALPLTAQTT